MCRDRQDDIKVLLALRLYSGLSDSVQQNRWVPKGIPAIYKLIAALDHDPMFTLDVVFGCMNSLNSKELYRIKKINLPPLNSQFIILPHIPFKSGVLSFCWKLFHFPLRRLTPIFNVLHFFYLIYLVVKHKYDVIYCDRTQIAFAGFCSYFLKKKVVFRLLGIYKDMHQLADSKTTFKNYLLKKCYSSPFSYCICTQDGSGGEIFIDKMINKKTPFKVIFNGVDIHKIEKYRIDMLRDKLNLINKQLIFLFIGKLEAHKGCLEFIDALVLLKKKSDNFFAVMVGFGPLYPILNKRILEGKLKDNVHLTGLINHGKVEEYIRLSDIYITLNQEGSLSNTTLESISHGKCIIRLCSDPLIIKIYIQNHFLIPSMFQQYPEKKLHKIYAIYWRALF